MAGLQRGPGPHPATDAVRPLEVALVQALGLMCLLAAVYAVYGPWYALAAFGVGVMLVAEAIGRRSPP